MITGFCFFGLVIWRAKKVVVMLLGCYHPQMSEVVDRRFALDWGNDRVRGWSHCFLDPWQDRADELNESAFVEWNCVPKERFNTFHEKLKIDYRGKLESSDFKEVSKYKCYLTACHFKKDYNFLIMSDDEQDDWRGKLPSNVFPEE